MCLQFLQDFEDSDFDVPVITDIDLFWQQLLKLW